MPKCSPSSAGTARATSASSSRSPRCASASSPCAPPPVRSTQRRIREAGTELVSEVRDAALDARDRDERACRRDAHAVPRSAERRAPAAAQRARAAGRGARAALPRAHRGRRLAARAVAGLAPGRGEPPLQAPVAHRLGGSSRAALEHHRGGARRAAQGHLARVLARPERLGAVASRRASSRSTARARR